MLYCCILKNMDKKVMALENQSQKQSPSLSKWKKNMYDEQYKIQIVAILVYYIIKNISRPCNIGKEYY